MLEEMENSFSVFWFMLFYFQVIASPYPSVFDETKWQDTLCSFYLSKSSLLDSLNKLIHLMDFNFNLFVWSLRGGRVGICFGSYINTLRGKKNHPDIVYSLLY